MRCKDAELRILDARERKLNQTEIKNIEQHLAQCAACTAFKSDLAKLRNGLNHLPQPRLSPDLAEKTQALCQQAFASKGIDTVGLSLKLRRFAVPKLIWASIPVVMALTTYIMLPGLKDLAAQANSFQSTAVLAVILQNAAMLVLAPILIRSYRRRKDSINWNPYDAHAS